MKLWMLTAFVSLSAVAAPKHKDLSPEQIRAIQAHQAQVFSLRKTEGATEVPLRPYSEVEEAGYFFMSADTDFDSAEAKRTMIQKLPSSVTAVVYAEPGSNKSTLASAYEGLIEPERLKIVEIPDTSNGFWARDGLPIAVWGPQAGLIEMVDAVYYYTFEPDALIASWFKAPVIKHAYNFEGGNFMVNDLGDCLTVDNDLSVKIPTDIFRQDYGCKTVLRLPFEKGIGHADESVRFMRSKQVVTDSANYAKTLTAAGFQVQMLPRPEREYETYVNALLVNDTVYVPIFGETNDDAALNVYRSFGLKVIPINTSSLSNDGWGSLHCITMTYPKVPFQALLQGLGAHEL